MPEYVATLPFKADGKDYSVGQDVPLGRITNSHILKETGLVALIESDTGQAASMAEVFGDDIAEDLQKGGYDSVEEVRNASEEELLAVRGIGSRSVDKIRASLKAEG